MSREIFTTGLIATNLKTLSANSWEKIFRTQSVRTSDRSRLKLEETTGYTCGSFIEYSKKFVQAASFAVVAAVATQFAHPVEAQAAPPAQPEISNNDISEDDFLDILIFFRNKGGKDLLGQFLTTAYKNNAGGISAMTEKAEIQKNPITGTIEFGDILADLNRDGKDGELEKELKIPPLKAKSQQPVAELKPEVQKILSVIKPDAQTTTSVASKKYDNVLEVHTTPEVAIQVWPEGVMLANIGKAALKTNEVPQMAILPEPTDFAYVEVPLMKLYGLNTYDDIIAWTARQMGISEAYARKIIGCESTFNPRAYNPSGARGWWQQMPEHAGKYASRGWNYYDEKDWADPLKNSIVAIEIMQRQGLGAWDCA